jgi:hypothetical protein
MKAHRGSRVTVPLLPDPGTRDGKIHAPAALSPEKNPGSGGRRAGLEVYGENCLTANRIELRTV